MFKLLDRIGNKPFSNPENKSSNLVLSNLLDSSDPCRLNSGQLLFFLPHQSYQSTFFQTGVVQEYGLSFLFKITTENTSVQTGILSVFPF